MGVAQLAEHQVVALRVVGSSPITHPIDRQRPLHPIWCGGLFLCLPGNGALYQRPHPISALGKKVISSKYYQYSFGLNLLPALNSGEIHHFWMDNSLIR